jgi:hypothetical protein
MRSEWAEVCESKCKEAASASSSVTVLNQAAAVRAGTGSFNPNADSSSIATDGEPGGVHVEFVTLTGVWEQYIAPRKVRRRLAPSRASITPHKDSPDVAHSLSIGQPRAGQGPALSPRCALSLASHWAPAMHRSFRCTC